jgi:hypothetical protein
MRLVVVVLCSLLAAAVLGCSGRIDESSQAVPPEVPGPLGILPSEPAPADPDPSRGAEAPAASLAANSPRAASAPAALVATTSPGLALLDVAALRLVATARTEMPVVDIAHDPWRERWLVVEYEDLSASRLSIWRVRGHQGAAPSLVREAAVELGGYARVVAAPQGVLLFEDDGLHARWMLLRDDLGAVVRATTHPAPAGATLVAGANDSHLVGAVTRFESEAPGSRLAVLRLAADAPWNVASLELPWGLSAVAPVRVAGTGAGPIVVAGSGGGSLVAARSGADDASVGSLSLGVGAGVGEVADAVCAEACLEAFVLLGSEGRVVAFDFRDGRASVVARAPVVLGSSRVFSRMMAYEPRTRRLLVGGASSLDVMQLGRSGAGIEVQRAPGWRGRGLKWPVAVGAALEGR